MMIRLKLVNGLIETSDRGIFDCDVCVCLKRSHIGDVALTPATQVIIIIVSNVAISAAVTDLLFSQFALYSFASVCFLAARSTEAHITKSTQEVKSTLLLLLLLLLSFASLSFLLVGVLNQHDSLSGLHHVEALVVPGLLALVQKSVMTRPKVLNTLLAALVFWDASRNEQVCKKTNSRNFTTD
eukprot:749742-Hanusia_phi.AAC.2